MIYFYLTNTHNKYGYYKIDQIVQTRKKFCIVVLHGADSGVLGAVLVVQFDSSKREGPPIPLLHTLGGYKSVAEGAAQCMNLT